jgi:hypothetical protein
MQFTHWAAKGMLLGVRGPLWAETGLVHGGETYAFVAAPSVDF